MRDLIFKIKENRKIAKDVYEMLLLGDASDITRPGQFINIKLDGFYLRRPISVCDWSEDEIKIIYKVVGEGTEYMSGLKEGDELQVLTALGNGYSIEELKFSLEKNGHIRTVLAGGGVGVPPLYGLAKKLLEAGVRPDVVLGFNGAEDVFYKKEFEDLGLKVEISTMDGSMGKKGVVTDVMRAEDNSSLYDYVFTCGPEPMLKAVYDLVPEGQFSFEARMACGFGACMGCSCKTKYGNKRICKDGPVLMREEIIW